MYFKRSKERKHIRHKFWDYSSDGYYFVTICTKNMKHFFGEVQSIIMELSDIGCIVYEQWIKTAKLRNNVILDEFIIMPNHIHVVIQIFNPSVGTHCNASLRNNRFGPQRNNLASIVRGFKSSVKRICNQNNIPFEWQSRFYDHIIRNEKSLKNIRRYIKLNPLKWECDKNNPEGLWM